MDNLDAEKFFQLKVIAWEKLGYPIKLLEIFKSVTNVLGPRGASPEFLFSAPFWLRTINTQIFFRDKLGKANEEEHKEIEDKLVAFSSIIFALDRENITLYPGNDIAIAMLRERVKQQIGLQLSHTECLVVLNAVEAHYSSFKTSLDYLNQAYRAKQQAETKRLAPETPFDKERFVSFVKIIAARPDVGLELFLPDDDNSVIPSQENKKRENFVANVVDTALRLENAVRQEIDEAESEE